jgi:hypothetical protein
LGMKFWSSSCIDWQLPIDMCAAAYATHPDRNMMYSSRYLRQWPLIISHPVGRVYCANYRMDSSIAELFSDSPCGLLGKTLHFEIWRFRRSKSCWPDVHIIYWGGDGRCDTVSILRNWLCWFTPDRCNSTLTTTNRMQEIDRRVLFALLRPWHSNPGYNPRQ